MGYRDPADEPEHICAELGELQPECNGYYCRLEREELLAAIQAPCKTHGIARCTICSPPLAVELERRRLQGLLERHQEVLGRHPGHVHASLMIQALTMELEALR